ncbi:hypothetical protein RRG08_031586 [Elysia crispata]|uniref:Uncharacterized protein n=1 Tax=Elysia crispata TaxID=231223 RepID=A0AAE1B2N8_9GAST|nr:hypothetical protein RRG08_031586 [Elysia crispata]
MEKQSGGKIETGGLFLNQRKVMPHDCSVLLSLWLPQAVAKSHLIRSQAVLDELQINLEERSEQSNINIETYDRGHT